MLGKKISTKDWQLFPHPILASHEICLCIHDLYSAYNVHVSPSTACLITAYPPQGTLLGFSSNTKGLSAVVCWEAGSPEYRGPKVALALLCCKPSHPDRYFSQYWLDNTEGRIGKGAQNLVRCGCGLVHNTGVPCLCTFHLWACSALWIRRNFCSQNLLKCLEIIDMSGFFFFFPCLHFHFILAPSLNKFHWPFLNSREGTRLIHAEPSNRVSLSMVCYPCGPLLHLGISEVAYAVSQSVLDPWLFTSLHWSQFSHSATVQPFVVFFLNSIHLTFFYCEPICDT